MKEFISLGLGLLAAALFLFWPQLRSFYERLTSTAADTTDVVEAAADTTDVVEAAADTTDVVEAAADTTARPIHE